MRRVALVTGSGHRLGRELALGLGRAGYDIAIHYRSRPADAEETRHQLAAAGAGSKAFRADLAEEGAPETLAAAVIQHFGRLDAVVHSASPWGEKPFLEVLPEDWDAVHRVGPRAAFFLVQGAARALQESSGAVLLVSDVAATKAWPRHIPHAVAKAALNALVVNLAVALAPDVRVNGIAPGVVLPPSDLDAEEVARLVRKTPLRRAVAMDDLVSLAVQLLGNDSVTGQVLAVDAGRSIV